MKHPFQLRRRVFLVGIIPLLIVAAVTAIGVGSTHVDWTVTLRVIGARLFPFWVDGSGAPSTDETIVWLIRVPRVLTAAFVGAGLAAAGVLMQGLFRNPLAEPNIVGVGSGAVLGAVIVFVSGLVARSALILPLAAFAGALIALAAVYTLATRGGATPVATLLLSGIAVSALLGAASSLLISLNVVDYQAAQEIIFWMMGGLDSRTWTHVWISVPFLLLAMALSLCYARDLDLLLQGEETAAALGVPVESSKRVIIATAALLTGSAVAVAGAVGFVGLIVPHVVRLLVGPSHRVLLPASILAGAAFLIFCDLFARTLHPPTEIRLGIITAAFGAPFFLFLLARRFHEGTGALDSRRSSGAAAPRLALPALPEVNGSRALAAVGLSVVRRGRRILDAASLDLACGTVLALVGPNGSGKSTMLRSLAGLWRAAEGKVVCGGRDLTDFSRQEIAREITYVPQETALNFEFSVREVVLMGRHPHRGRFERETAEDLRAAEEAMERADLLHIADRPVTTLSGGERQRVLIARSLATRARILLLDEPTANLDVDHALDVLDLCRSLAKEGRAVAIATHDLNAVRRFADRVALIESGRLIANGEPDAVLTPENLERAFRVQTETLVGADGTPVLMFRRKAR